MFEHMNPEWKDKWVTALRSGDYLQGAGKLTTGEDTFCCLGVLCNIFDPKGWGSNGPDAAYAYGYGPDNPEYDVEEDDSTSIDDHSNYWDGTHSETEIPDSLADHLNIAITDQQTLIAFNDGINGVRNPLGLHLLFGEIADLIQFDVLPDWAIA